MKRTLRVALFLPFACAAIATFSNIARAQQIDVAVGGASIFAPSASQATGIHEQQSLAGGLYPVVSGDVLFFGHVGVEGEVSWRGNQGIYFPGYLNLHYRPFFYDANAIWAPKLTKRISVDLMGGAGGLMTRFYTGAGCKGCSNYSTTNRFMADVGGGIKYYVWRRFFVRPEARLYLINNNVEFSSAHALRYGAFIGYTFKKKQ